MDDIELRDMTDTERWDFVRQSVNRLSEVFPAVQVLVSWDCGNGETGYIPLGYGSFFARSGMASEFLESGQDGDVTPEIMRHIDREMGRTNEDDISGND